MLNKIINGKRPVSAEMSLLLEAALGIDASLWNNLQSRYNLENNTDQPLTAVKHTGNVSR